MVTILLLYFVTFSSSQTYPAQSDGDFILVEQVSLTFDQANDYCLSTYGTTLVSIHNDAENSVVANLVSDSPECGNAHTGMLAKSGLHWTDNTAYDYQPGGSTQHMITNGCGSKYQCGHVGASGSWWCGDCAKSWTDVCLVCNGPNYPTTPDPTIAPSNMPSLSPTTTDPTIAPSNMPSLSPTTTDPTIAPSNMPSLSPTTTEAQSELYYIHGKLCNNLDQHLELIYDVTLVECVKRCKYAVGDNCLLINYFNYFKNNNDSRCYVFAKLCDIKVDSNNNNRSIIVYKTYNEKCIDYPSNWKDNIGDSCTYYLSSNWCNNETILQNQNEFILLSDYTYGLSAISTCCECGGGIDLINDVALGYDNNWDDSDNDILCTWTESDFTLHLEPQTTLREWDNLMLHNLCSHLEDINCEYLINSDFSSNLYSYSLFICGNHGNTDSMQFIFDILLDDVDNKHSTYINNAWFSLDLSYYSSNINVTFMDYSNCIEQLLYSINFNNTYRYGSHPCHILNTISPTTDPTYYPTIYPTLNPTMNNDLLTFINNDALIICIILLLVSLICIVGLIYCIKIKKKTVDQQDIDQINKKQIEMGTHRMSTEHNANHNNDILRPSAPTLDDNERADSNIHCILCCDNKANMFNDPCGHVTYCKQCSSNNLLDGKCPTCRQVMKCKQIYNAGFSVH
eukprot:26319_1